MLIEPILSLPTLVAVVMVVSVVFFAGGGKQNEKTLAEGINGEQLNLIIGSRPLQGEEGDRKLRSVMEAYFDGGGMELQINVVSAETLRDAQDHPENYQDLVVRVAGFSAYFVEVYKEAQDDLIHRTEMSV